MLIFRQGDVGGRADGHEQQGQCRRLGGTKDPQVKKVQIRNQIIGEKKCARQCQAAGSYHVFHRDEFHDPPYDGNQCDKHQGSRGQGKPRPGRRVGKLRLGELGNNDRACVQHEAHHTYRNCAEREVAIAKYSQVHHWIAGV